ncbi:MAG: hypothetical protein B0D96_00940 [Candidatus Sedimenticola endophacoides]|uniref:N-acetyltransferase domain-containing protein n=1 Tax=Candidatus Sedimenticola endophacoides TaxID=2548426 RepID=A0A6N4DKY8_9GAMM|nr:MAG: hypothetical protein B0D94_08840 [Candidatus Sedimenticola endophacoides]OQX38013.1 MAG: hypothetical protein B0D96_00940 [Candidatus Sedimenticola endophacoides]OQX38849.1 MAG: hypothetical protein B0D89_11900 [Candidatus Sedimenticola endophacoides]OQX43767.1 MAG: hypothetical protein B0D88_03815 [Candidatus Sedimenticola endophacoides]PUD98242.1 MAG: hypothetical protein C3L24_13110 [Candidatus Sedimenticola endophacoides]
MTHVWILVFLMADWLEQFVEQVCLFSGELSSNSDGGDEPGLLRYTEHEADLSIDYLFVPVVMRGRGVGTQLVSRLLRYADCVGKDVEVQARPLGGGGQVQERLRRLIRFYRRLGFEERVQGITQMHMVRRHMQ